MSAFLNAADFPSVQAAVDVIPNGGCVEIPPGTRDEGVLNLANRSNITLVGAGVEATDLLGPTSGQCAVDMTGAENCVLERLRLTARGTNCGLLLARSQSRQGGARNVFRDVHLQGDAVVSLVYNYGGESNEFHGVRGAVTAQAAWAYYHTATNSYGLSSPHTPMVSGPQSSGNVSFFGGSLVNYANGPGEAALIDGGGGLRFFGTYFAGSGQRVVRLVNALQAILFEGAIFEPTNAGWPVCSIEHIGGLGGAMTALELAGCSLFSGGGFSGLKGVDGVNFPGLRISGSLCNQPGLFDIWQTMGAVVQLGGGATGRLRDFCGGSVFLGGDNEHAMDLPATTFNTMHLPWQGQARKWGV